MMKIGFVLPANMAFAGPGNGVRVAAEHMAEALARAGHEVARLDSWQWTADRVRGLDVVQVFLGAFSNFMLENMRPDPIRMLSLMPTIDSNEPNWRYRLAASLGNVASRVYTVPGEMRRQAMNCDLVVCRSSHERERVIHGLGIDPRRVGVEVVRLGVNPPGDADPEGLRKRLGLPREFVLHVSAYAQARKNVVRLIEAIGPAGLPLVIAGTAEPGPTLDRIRALARQYSGTVTLLGYQDPPSLRSLYAACKVFCLPTVHEGVGLVGLEAASYGAAVAVTSRGGPPDYYGSLAEYLDPFDTASIRRAVLAAWAKPPGTALRDHVVTNLTWDHTAGELARAYAKYGRATSAGRT